VIAAARRRSIFHPELIVASSAVNEPPLGRLKHRIRDFKNVPRMRRCQTL
jgi:hypothetical protein